MTKNYHSYQTPFWQRRWVVATRETVTLKRAVVAFLILFVLVIFWKGCSSPEKTEGTKDSTVVKDTTVTRAPEKGVVGKLWDKINPFSKPDTVTTVPVTVPAPSSEELRLKKQLDAAEKENARLKAAAALPVSTTVSVPAPQSTAVAKTTVVIDSAIADQIATRVAVKLRTKSSPSNGRRVYHRQRTLYGPPPKF